MRDSWQLMRRFLVLWWLPIGVATVAGVVMRLASSHIQDDPLRLARFGPLVLVGMVFAPAMASGYNGVVRAAIVDAPPRWHDFWGNLRTYYWRFVGGFVLASLVALLPLLYMGNGGVGVGVPTLAGDWRSGFVMLLITGLFGEVWLAAVVIDGVGIRAGVLRATQSLLTRFGDYALPLSLAVAGGFLVPTLLQSAVAASTAYASWLSSLGMLFSASSRAFVRVAVIRAYRGQA